MSTTEQAPPSKSPDDYSSFAMTPQTQRFLLRRRSPELFSGPDIFSATDVSPAQTPECRNHDPEIFYLPGDMGWTSRNALKRLAAAKAICGVCPVIETCLERAIESGDQHAFLGGKTPDERNAIAEARWNSLLEGIG